MKRIDRLTAILILLQAKRIVTAREIAARYAISLRTVYRDIRALEEAGVPVGAEAGKGYFLTEGFHLPPVMFTAQEAGALLLGAKLVEKFSDIGVNRSFAEALDKIKAVLGNTDQDHLNRLDALVTVLNAVPAGREGFPGDLLIDIQSVLAQSKVTRLQYVSGYKDQLTTRKVEPLGLCFYAGHWHLLAYCHLRRDYRDFRVDRVKTVAVTGEGFDRNRHGDLQELVQHMVLARDLKSATLLFSRRAARLVRDYKHYYGFVRQWEQEDGVKMEFLVPDYDYLVHWLLSLVDQVTVIAPAKLKQSLRASVRRLTAHLGL